jgi:uncharacterized membrane protein YeaQ/YmgE (transglycosylase-associated protein family)
MTLVSVLILIIFGAIIGWVASLIVDTDEGFLLDVVVGAIGSVIGGWIMGFFNEGGVTGINVYSFLVALLGAVVLLVIIKAIRRI